MMNSKPLISLWAKLQYGYPYNETGFKLVTAPEPMPAVPVPQRSPNFQKQIAKTKPASNETGFKLVTAPEPMPAVPVPQRSPNFQKQIAKIKPASNETGFKLVIGLEPMTCALRMRCSTN